MESNSNERLRLICRKMYLSWSEVVRKLLIRISFRSLATIRSLNCLHPTVDTDIFLR